ncbi:MAG: hypothetical protein WBP41_09835 [Saprospiraceae bacterium]
MNRRTKLALGFAVAGITFASLMAFTGRGNHFRQPCDHHCGYTQHHNCHGGAGMNNEKSESNQGSKSVEDDSTKANH